MNLIIELLIVFAGAFAVGLAWQKARRLDWGRAAHRAMVIGMLAMLLWFLILVAARITGLHPLPGG